MALRSLAFDRAATRYPSTHPSATVVALAEGLQTSFWRLSSALPETEFSWLTVDFRPIIELRQRLLPPPPVSPPSRLLFHTLFPAFWRLAPTKQFRGAYTLLEFGRARSA